VTITESAVYSVIYADPPWKFKTYSEKGLGRSAEAWYDCLTLDEIKAIPVRQWASQDCVLLLWVTDPFLRKGFEVLDAWGFEYKTVGFYWAKSKYDNGALNNEHNWPIGTGYWTRANPEQCLLATRGSPKRINNDVRKLVISPRREHSRKPDEIYERIERLCEGPYLELFARQPWPGWDSIGQEVVSGPNSQRRWRSNSGPERERAREPDTIISVAEILGREESEPNPQLDLFDERGK
jgi:N6-adenosine-specific RNA methylase IME4